jgi:hypothetical protein
MSREVEIVKIGDDTKISLNLKTLFWIIGLVILLFSSVLTIGYFDIKKEQKLIKEKYESEKLLIMEDVSKILKDELKDLKVKDEKLSEDISEIKGDIKVLLDRSRRSVSPSTSPDIIINHSPDTESLPDIF